MLTANQEIIKMQLINMLEEAQENIHKGAMKSIDMDPKVSKVLFNIRNKLDDLELKVRRFNG